eukprot:TRINITY_DN74758_c0_g1_i1.p1 TRINITY_DN74758_c0_g1~~TRINITY_DN74758_c0_g1_i1.p1  ORF type:complete len:195 (-),score=18.62 TRINITY_DN74758_c0_g1_i1:286-819(-)
MSQAPTDGTPESFTVVHTKLYEPERLFGVVLDSAAIVETKQEGYARICDIDRPHECAQRERAAVAQSFSGKDKRGVLTPPSSSSPSLSATLSLYGLPRPAYVEADHASQSLASKTYQDRFVRDAGTRGANAHIPRCSDTKRGGGARQSMQVAAHGHVLRFASPKDALQALDVLAKKR